MSEESDLLRALKKFSVDAAQAVDDTVRITAHKVRVSAIKEIREPSVGTYYIRNGVAHVASKPGDAPNTDTGRLIGSIRMEHDKGMQNAFVGTDLDYGAFLELLMDRPWLQPSLDRHIPDFEKTMHKVVEKQIKKAAK
jgi:signal-transduction protein with cAMP-binding, CBS, and nucleotidyltransferase domain